MVGIDDNKDKTGNNSDDRNGDDLDDRNNRANRDGRDSKLLVYNKPFDLPPG